MKIYIVSLPAPEINMSRIVKAFDTETARAEWIKKACASYREILGLDSGDLTFIGYKLQEVEVEK